MQINKYQSTSQLYLECKFFAGNVDKVGKCTFYCVFFKEMLKGFIFFCSMWIIPLSKISMSYWFLLIWYVEKNMAVALCLGLKVLTVFFAYSFLLGCFAAMMNVKAWADIPINTILIIFRQLCQKTQESRWILISLKLSFGHWTTVPQNHECQPTGKESVTISIVSQN